MNTIDVILDKLGVSFDVLESDDGVKEYILADDVDEPWGFITVCDNKAYFVHGNAEPEIDLDSPKLPKWVEAYNQGFDEFDDIILE